MPFLIVFAVFFVVIYTLHARDDRAALRTFVLASLLTLISYATSQMGFESIVVGYLLSIHIAMKVMGYTLSSAVLLLIVFGFITQLINLGFELY